MTLRKREKKFQHPQIWAGRARGGRARQGADGRAPPPQLQGRRGWGGWVPPGQRGARAPQARQAGAQRSRSGAHRSAFATHGRGGGRLCRRSARLPAATAAARAVPPPRYLRKCFKAPAPRSQRVPCLCSPVSVAPLRPRKPLPSGVVALRFGRLVGVIPSASERLQQRSSRPLRRDLLVTPM